jgi:thioredoxin 1
VINLAEKLTVDNFDEFISQSDVPVLVDFYNDGCIPCRRIAPLLSKAEEKYNGKIKFARVNSALNPDLIEKYTIEAAPTLILFKSGEEINRHRGIATADQIEELINTNNL